MRGLLGDDASDCCPVSCVYQPVLVGMLRFIRDRALGMADEAPADAYDLADLVCAETGRSDDHERERWACILADLARAEAAGCRSDAEVSEFLCPRYTPRGEPRPDARSAASLRSGRR